MGKVDLGGLGGPLHALQRDGRLGQIHLVLPPELVERPVDDPVVEVDPAEKVVAAGGQRLEDVLLHLQHGDVEGATTQVVDQDLLVEPPVEAVRQRGGCRLVDDPPDLEAGQLSGLLHGVALEVVVVGWHRDDGLGHGPAQEGLGDRLHMGQHHPGDLGEAVDLSAERNRRLALWPLHDVVRVVRPEVLDDAGVELAPDEPLGAVDGVARVDEKLVLGRSSHEQVAAAGERDHAGKDEASLVGGDDPRDAVADVGHAGVRGSQVDPDDGLVPAGGRRHLVER
jgi:hypothetical protein